MAFDGNPARFTVNGLPSEDGSGNRGVVVANGALVTLQLEVIPSGVLSATFQLFDAADPSSPLASLNAPVVNFLGSGTPSELLTDPDTQVATFNFAGVGINAYLCRCTVATASGPAVFERAIVSRGATSSLRKTFPAESQEFEARGWSDELNRMVDAIETLAAAGGGGWDGGVNANVPPAAPDALNDEFSGGVLDAAWSVFNEDGFLTEPVVQSNGMVLLEQSQAGGLSMAGIHKAAPVIADFTVVARMLPLLERGNPSSAVLMGIFLAEDIAADPTGAAFISVGMNVDAKQVHSSSRPSYDGAGAGTVTENTNNTGMYVRLRCEGNVTIYADYSYDGISWRASNQFVSALTGPLHMGLFISNQSTGINYKCRFDWIRVFPGIAFDTPVGGVL